MLELYFKVLLAPSVVEDRLKPPHIQYPAWVYTSDGRNTIVRMITDDPDLPRKLFQDVVLYPDKQREWPGKNFETDSDYPLPGWFDLKRGRYRTMQIGVAVVLGHEEEALRTFYHSQYLPPAGAPVWTARTSGRIKATIMMAKPKSKIFQKPQPIEEIIGGDETEMGEHLADFLAWLRHYDQYYSCEGWTYEVKWKR